MAETDLNTPLKHMRRALEEIVKVSREAAKYGFSTNGKQTAGEWTDTAVFCATCACAESMDGIEVQLVRIAGALEGVLEEMRLNTKG